MNPLKPARRLFVFERLLLIFAFAAVAGTMAWQLWGTAFTCDDDLFTATAWQRWGGGARGWTAVGRASWVMACDQGRFYQLVAYTVTQAVYQLGSFEAINTVRIATLLFVFASFAAMTISLTRSFRFAMYVSILAAGLIEATYHFNPFHAYPLWFNLAIGLLFVAVLFFQEALRRESIPLTCAAAIVYFCSLLFYESFVFYSIVFFGLALAHGGAPPARRKAVQCAILKTWPLAVAAALYMGLYFAFSYRYPGTYAGRVLTLASFPDITRTIVLFSVSGLNFRKVLPEDFAWNSSAILVALIVLLAAFLTMRRLHRRPPSTSLVLVGGAASICMLLPNILYGFSARYRHWAVAYNHYYLGSFYSAFAEAILIGVLSLWIVQQAGRVRLGGVATAGLAVFFAVAAYSNVQQAEAFYAGHRENRKLWDLVDAAVSTGNVSERAQVLVAPRLVQMHQLSPWIYDYWNFYFSEKLHQPVRVIGKASEFRLLPERSRSGPVFAFAPSYFRELRAGLFAYGQLDVDAWQNEGRLLGTGVHVGILGGSSAVYLFEVTGEHPGGTMIHGGGPQVTIEGRPVDLNSLVLRYRPAQPNQ